MDEVSIYDNEKATYWYCKAAKQGYGPAQLRLARVYSGHPIHGLHVALRASALIGTAETDLGVALMWANVAVNHGVGDAAALRDEIMERSTAKEREGASARIKSWQSAPCQWAEVFASTGSTRP
jgi:TPR repeat protein